MSYNVEYYELEDGSKPAENFILAQDYKMQAKISVCGNLIQSRWETGFSRSGQN